jgi:anti-sigma regulatory factor (Ser/Thr protein kinase)/ActR/RegA family two-component response regulator
MPPIAVRNALVVDADPQLKALLTNVLPHGLWAIHYVVSNKEALKNVLNRSFDLILTGEKTSALQDVELLRTIRRLRPHTRLIILTSQSTPAAVLDSMRAHAFSLFSTPYSSEDLGSMIQLAIDSPPWDDGIELISATPEWIRLRLRCEVHTADRLVQFLNEIAELPADEREQVAVAFREMLMNAIEHGGQLNPNRYVEIEYVRAKHMVSCHIADPGPGFTLDEIPHAAVANPTDNPIQHAEIREELGIRPGGYGIFIAQKLVDELIFNQDGNEVLLVKYLKPAS